MSQGPVDIDMSPYFDFGGPRTKPILGIAIHTSESAPGTPAKNVADYQLRSRTGSYHRVIDTDAVVVMENTDDWTTWSSGNLGNEVLLHVALVTRANMTRAQWLAPDHARMLDRLAELLAHWSKKHGIPLVVLDGPDLLRKTKGLYGHDDTRIWGGTDHYDPGPHFPWDEVAARAQRISAGTNGKAPAVASLEDKVDRILHEVTQLHPSRSQYRETDAPMDTIGGFAITADARAHEALTEIRALRKQVASLEAALTVQGK